MLQKQVLLDTAYSTGLNICGKSRCTSESGAGGQDQHHLPQDTQDRGTTHSRTVKGHQQLLQGLQFIITELGRPLLGRDVIRL